MAPAQTYGWDMVLAARTSVLNAALTETCGDFTQTVPHGNGPVDVTGSLGVWQITTGGSGSLVKFTVPCATLKLSQGKKSFTFTDGAFLVEATLEFSAAATGEARSLRIVSGKGAVSAQSADFDDDGFAGFAAIAVAGLQAWLDAQTDFPYEIADATLAGAGDGGPAAALVPQNASYAYADAGDGGDGVLALLCSVAAGGGGVSGLLQEVDPAALGHGDGAVLLGEGLMARLVDLALSRVSFAGAASHPGAKIDAALSLPMDPKAGG